VLAPGTPALLNLKSLELVGMDMDVFTSAVGRALKCLTHLNLEANRFSVLPHGVAIITTLKTLILSCNEPLILEQGDVDVLKALPNLRSLHTWRCLASGRYDTHSTCLLDCIRQSQAGANHESLSNRIGTLSSHLPILFVSSSSEGAVQSQVENIGLYISHYIWRS